MKPVRSMKRRGREIETAGIMIDMYCRYRHGADARCGDCKELYEYVRQKTLACRFGEDKPACGKCQIHCYQSNMREKIRAAMRFSGPRMIYCHPILAFRHWIASSGKTSAMPSSRGSRTEPLRGRPIRRGP